MAQYQLKDNQTGKTVTVEGNTPPSQQQAEAIFQKAGLRQAKAPEDTSIGSSIGGTVGSVGGAVVGGAADVETGVVPGAVAGSVAGGALGSGLGSFVQQLFEKKPLSPKEIASQTGQGALFGLIPGGAEDNLGIRLLSRFGLGMLSSTGAQVIDDISKGKKLDHNTVIDTLMNAGAAGTMATIAPEALQKLGKFAFGDASKLSQQLARSFVSAEYADNPDITKHIDYSSWKNTVANLQGEMGRVYKPLQEALSKQTANLGEFLDTVKTGLNQSTLHQDIIDRNVSELVKQIGRQSTGALKNLTDEYNRLDAAVKKYPMSSGMAGARARSQFAAKQKVLDQIMQQDVPLNILNEAKKNLGESGIYQDAQGAYFAAKKFIEDHAQGTDVKGINQQYNSLKDVVTEVEKRFGSATRDVKTGEPYSWTMRAGLVSALGTLANVLGLTGHPAALLTNIPLAAYFGKQLAMEHPGSAQSYIKAAGNVEKGAAPLATNITTRIAPAITKLVQDIVSSFQQQPQDQGGQQQ